MGTYYSGMNMVMLMPGTSTGVELNRRKSKLLQAPHGDCTTQEYLDMSLDSSYRYVPYYDRKTGLNRYNYKGSGLMKLLVAYLGI